MDSLNSVNLKIDNRTKYGVYGWIREAEKELQLSDIPDAVCMVIILFYRYDDSFDIYDESIKLSDDQKMIIY